MMPPWVGDQVQAASADAVRQLRVLGAEHGWQYTESSRDPWITGLFVQLWANMRLGQVVSCVHLRSPRPAYSAAWRLHVLCCQDCMIGGGALAPPPGQDARCDRCGQDAPGRIRPKMMAAGPVVLLAGLCPACNEQVAS